VLKTLGFSGGTLCALVLAESLLLCLSAAILGLLLSAVAIKIVGSALGTGVLPDMVIAGGLGIAALLAIISALPPAVRAQRLNIVDALAVH
jgi:putative ABC transport system permease protein